MDNLNVLKGYRERMQLLASAHFISEFVTNRRDFKEFDNQEFYNFVIQILCFIMDKSLKGKYCFRENIIEYSVLLNEDVYKKQVTRTRIEEAVYYILRRGLRNDGYTYRFNYYDYDQSKNDVIKVQLVDDEIVKFDGQDKTNYFLTERGYKLLFSTKEYDDAFQIQITKFIAEMKIINGDYQSAKIEVEKLINLLEIQCQKIDNYIQTAKKDISIIENQKYSDVMLETFNILLSQQSNYVDLKHMVNEKLELLYKEDIRQDKIKKSISDIKDILYGLDNAIGHIKKLHSKKTQFSRQYEELIKSILLTHSNGTYDFEKIITNRIEEDIELIPRLQGIYKSLFKIQSPNIFSLHIPYGEQNIEMDNIKIDDTGREIENDFEENLNYAEINNGYYLEFLKEFIAFGNSKDEFTLKQFIDAEKENTERYIRLTRYGSLIREIFLFFSHSDGIIDMEKIKFEELSRVSHIEPTEKFDILYIVSELIKDSNEKLPAIQIELEKETFSFNTSIDLDNKTALKLTMPNMKFFIG